MKNGLEILENTWKVMPPQARTEYEHLVLAFIKSMEQQPGIGEFSYYKSYFW
jgi:hypothetical protein